MSPPGETETILHASSVAVGPRGLLITGKSGSGKSSLALDLMAIGATLVSDDRTHLRRTPEGALTLHPAPNIAGLIEARGVGLLRAQFVAGVPLAAMIDLDQIEAERLPERREVELLGVPVPLLHKPGTPSLAPALLQYLRGGPHT